MKNELPPVTATYFITLIKDYLQGAKTKQEIITETSGLIALQSPSAIAPADITHLLITAARDINEHFYFDIVEKISHASDTAPTRSGLLHHLEACIAGHISPEELLEWATWHQTGDAEEVPFEDPAVEYFCLQWLPAAFASFAIKKIRQVLEIFSLNCGSLLKEKIALVLLSEKEKQHFFFFLRDYIDHRKTAEELDLYLLKKFGMDHLSFPYMAELVQGGNSGERLEALLKKAALISEK
jgi:hypothetical protein